MLSAVEREVRGLSVIICGKKWEKTVEMGVRDLKVSICGKKVGESVIKREVRGGKYVPVFYTPWLRANDKIKPRDHSLLSGISPEMHSMRESA